MEITIRKLQGFEHVGIPSGSKIVFANDVVWIDSCCQCNSIGSQLFQLECHGSHILCKRCLEVLSDEFGYRCPRGKKRSNGYTVIDIDTADIMLEAVLCDKDLKCSYISTLANMIEHWKICSTKDGKQESSSYREESQQEKSEDQSESETSTLQEEGDSSEYDSFTCDTDELIRSYKNSPGHAEPNSLSMIKMETALRLAKLNESIDQRFDQLFSSLEKYKQPGGSDIGSGDMANGRPVMMETSNKPKGVNESELALKLRCENNYHHKIKELFDIQEDIRKTTNEQINRVATIIEDLRERLDSLARKVDLNGPQVSSDHAVRMFSDASKIFQAKAQAFRDFNNRAVFVENASQEPSGSGTAYFT